MINVGLIGCGRIAEVAHLPCYQRLKGVQVVALCDFNRTRAKKLSRKFGVAKTYGSPSELFGKEKLDFVDICTPGFTHHQLCMEAIQNGVNILVEKPLALSVTRAEELDKASKIKGVKVCVVHDYRFKEPFAKAMSMYKKGKIGKIKEITSVQHGLSIYSLPSWLWNEQRTGGILYELGIHIVDLQAWFCGKHEKIIGIDTEFDPKLNYHTSLQAIIKYKSGATGILDLVWFSSSPVFYFDVYGTATDVCIRLFPERFEVASGFSLSPTTDFFIEAKRVLAFSKKVLLRQRKKHAIYSFMRLLSDYVIAIKEDKEPPVSVKSVMNTMRLLEDLRMKVGNFGSEHTLEKTSEHTRVKRK